MMAHLSRTIGFIKYTNSVLKTSIPSSITCTKMRYLHTSDIKCDIRHKKWYAPMLMEFKTRVDYLKRKGLYPKTVRSQFLDWNYDSEIYAFGKRLNEEFDLQLLQEALTDASYIHTERERLKEISMETTALNLNSNNNLADAGKELIQNFSTKFLRAACPLLPEEAIGSFVDYLTSDEVLGKIAKDLGFTDLILTKEYPPNEVTFARSFAAVVGCLDECSGRERCHFFIRDFVVTHLVGKDIWDLWQIDEPFNILEGILLRSGKGHPEPRLLGELGKNTVESVFYVGIYDDDKNLIGKGYGETAGVGVKVAAYDALGKIFNQTNAKAPLPFQSKDISMYLKEEPNTSINQWTLSDRILTQVQ